MKRLLYLLPLALIHLSSCKEKRYFTDVTGRETWLSQIVFEDGSKRDFTVVSDVLYAGEALLFCLNYGAFLVKINMGDAFNTALAFLIVGALIAGSIYLLKKN
ncbi:MAG: hypothetical protein IJ151_03955 [Bacteroidales bacterium]|nr:hypothetical protein [Bacteroidales bacterium]